MAATFGIVSADPLVARALTASLVEQGLHAVTGQQVPEAVLWDPEEDEPCPEVSGRVLAVVAAASRARAALVAGASGVVRRDATPERLAAAIHAVLTGLRVVDEPFCDDLLALPSAPPGTVEEPLTGREQEVLELVAEGLSNREIAEVLNISAHTVKFHLNAVLTKLDATTRTEAVVNAARWGVLLL